MRRYLFLHQPRANFRMIILAGMGGGLAIGILGYLTSDSGYLFLMAPFGASSVLLFSAPASPFSQPPNVIGGHFIATLVGLILRLYLPNEWWAVALSVGLVISLMAALRITHPPAGADPIVVFLTHPGFEFLLFPVILGSLGLVVIASLYHKASATQYPFVRVP